MQKQNYNFFILIWSTQTLSTLGNLILSYGIGIWIFLQTHRALDAALGITAFYLPAWIFSRMVEKYIKLYSPEKILLYTSLCGLFLWALIEIIRNYQQSLITIYFALIISGFLKSFQVPALAIFIRKYSENNDYQKNISLFSLGNATTALISPEIATVLLKVGNGNINSLLITNIISYFGIIYVLLRTLKIKNIYSKEENKEQINPTKINIKKKYPTICILIVFTSVMSFCSNRTYESILSPMILSRSNENQTVLAIVNSFFGLGSICGGILLTKKIFTIKNPYTVFYLSALISFLFGDSLMALGQNCLIWCLAAIAATIPMPFVTAASNMIVYQNASVNDHPKLFTQINSWESLMIPIGAFLGGYLADNFFTPLISRTNNLSFLLEKVVGKTEGSGMALMFLGTSIIGSFLSISGFFINKMISINKK
ncbi:MFS transporter [Oenococcus oeni]|uniref:MFS transporter n=1 Tax=Oenococcus oeni TaxID=1247 RepID=UPI0008F8F377|nr:MFS transporter [Oenococcus oeni]OIK99565.1 MFS transporter [Oenococcus oeni]PDH75496.1 MFS transporter [Oenococcus oeni]PDH88378.1 MFS transporter [Oenococcus oeni]PDH91755.1 MFS transporter [Oenococcus oeni]PDH95232.1 MFS transporter [Oenococcus oeni]